MKTYVAFTWTGAEQGAGVIGVYMSEEKAQLAIEQAASDDADPGRYYKVSESILDLEPSRKPLPAYPMFDPQSRQVFDESMQRISAMLAAMPKPHLPPIKRDPLQYVSESTLGDRQIRHRSRVIEQIEKCIEGGQLEAALEKATPEVDKIQLVCKEMVDHLENHKPKAYFEDKEYADAYIHQQAKGVVERWVVEQQKYDDDEGAGDYVGLLIQPVMPCVDSKLI